MLIQIFSLMLLYAIVRIVFMLQGFPIPWCYYIFQVFLYDLEELFILQFWGASTLAHFATRQKYKSPITDTQVFCLLVNLWPYWSLNLSEKVESITGWKSTSHDLFTSGLSWILTSKRLIIFPFIFFPHFKHIYQLKLTAREEYYNYSSFSSITTLLGKNRC